MSIKPDDLGSASSRSAGTGALPPYESDLEIARSVTPEPVLALAGQRLGLEPDVLVPYGHHKAKIEFEQLPEPVRAARGRLVLVTAVSPTPAGEGKTTTSIGLADGLNRLGLRATACLREPSLGPCFGMKGGAAGGGRAQVIPMEDINLHFNGDFHAITTAHNLLAALLDNHLHWSNELGVDARRVSWRRVIDLNDRALRDIVTGLGGPAHGVPRETGFDITAASEIMAILCLADGIEDLEKRLGDIVVARRRDFKTVTARDLGADGALAALLKDALKPNLVQTLEHNPVFMHGGPFANIAHGCNSVAATRTALELTDIVVTEAGFGADLGAEKFIDIKCRSAGLFPDAVVLVCTVRALKYQGGKAKAQLEEPDVDALRAGAVNLERHLENLARFGLSPIVAINRFPGDSDAEIATLIELAGEFGAVAVVADHWRQGGDGAVALAQAVADGLADGAPQAKFLYPDEMPLVDKIRSVACGIYGAADIALLPQAARQLREFEELGFGHLPVCIAKTQYSFSDDAARLGAPKGHILPVAEARLAAGAGFVVILCGSIMTMPGLPRHPAALDIGLDDQGRVEGLS